MSLAVGDAARLDDGTLGVVCYGPTSDGNVTLLREDASKTDSIKASALARPSEAELAALKEVGAVGAATDQMKGPLATWMQGAAAK